MSLANQVSEVSILAKIVKGYGVASGRAMDSRFPEGTIAMQIPHFQKRGLDFKNFFLGSLNLDVSPYSFKLQKPDFSFSQIYWSPDLPPENFSFYSCSLQKEINNSEHEFEGLVYWPHPSTKPEFHQTPNVLEVIAPYIPDLHYGDYLRIRCSSRVILFQK